MKLNCIQRRKRSSTSAIYNSTNSIRGKKKLKSTNESNLHMSPIIKKPNQVCNLRAGQGPRSQAGRKLIHAPRRGLRPLQKKVLPPPSTIHPSQAPHRRTLNCSLIDLTTLHSPSSQGVSERKEHNNGSQTKNAKLTYTPIVGFVVW